MYLYIVDNKSGLAIAVETNKYMYLFAILKI